MLALYGRAPATGLAQRAALAAHGHEHARLRIDFVPGEELSVVVTALGAIEPAVLRPVTVPGGLGPHKWRDRTLLKAHESDDPATLPLLVDADGFLLEASRANVVLRAGDGTLYTPPADGRILPGVTVARAGATERVLTLEDLRAAEAIYVTSALRGLQPATLSRSVRKPAA